MMNFRQFYSAAKAATPTHRNLRVFPEASRCTLADGRVVEEIEYSIYVSAYREDPSITISGSSPEQAIEVLRYKLGSDCTTGNAFHVAVDEVGDISGASS